jgi:VWFA-related protein
MLRKAKVLGFPGGIGAAGVALAVLAAVAAPGVAYSQEDTPGSFGDIVDVVVVEVPVVVTDPSGRRVTGLEPDDFRLLVDGSEIPIDYFAEIQDGRAVAVASGEGAPVAERGDAVPTNHLLFIDEYFSIAARRDYVVGKVLDQLEGLPAQDRMAVVAFDGERVEVLADWSADRNELRQALTRALERPAYGLVRADEWERRIWEREETGPTKIFGPAGRTGSSLDFATGAERVIADTAAAAEARLINPFHDVWAQDWELHRELNAVRAALRVIPRPAGRNVLHLLAGGWPTGAQADILRPHEGRVLASLPTGYGRETPLDDLELIRPLIDTANLLGYTVYPVDMDGLRPESATLEAFRQGTLRALADGTGGRALLFEERAESLGEVVRDTRAYYSLGFLSARRNDDAYHPIRVEVVRPGADVRSRAGYRDFSRDTEIDLLTESALRFRAGTMPTPAGEGLLVEVGAPQRRPGDTMKVPLALEVPWSTVTLMSTPEGLRSRLEIRVAARDLDGALSEVVTVPLGLSLTGQAETEGSFRWTTDVLLRREPHDLVVSLYDAASGRVLTRTVSVRP